MKKNGKKTVGKRGRRPVHTKRDMEIVRMHTQGIVHPQIAEHYGITRERVRQIVANHDQEPRRVFQRRRRAENDARQAAESRQRKQKREARLHALSAAWKRGASISEIAEEFGISTPNAANALISYRRKRHPSLFPLRKPWVSAHRTPKPKSKSKN
jgi:transposase